MLEDNPILQVQMQWAIGSKVLKELTWIPMQQKMA